MGGARRRRHAGRLEAAGWCRPSLLERNRPGALAGTRGIDFISVDGAANLPYDIPNVRVEYTEFDPGIPFGFWRSVGASVNGYVVEAFFDEVAAAGGHDPYELRRRLLRNHPRHKAALELAAERSTAGRRRPPRDGRAASPSSSASAAS